MAKRENSSKIILIIAAHPDDEVLGCGGTMARHAAAGDAVHVMFMADGVSSRGGKKGLAARKEAARRACKILGAKPPVFLGLPDNQMDKRPLLEAVQILEKALAKIAPDVVYTHHSGDLNIDHQITHRAVMTACRPLPGSRVMGIYGFEVLSSTEWAAPDPALAFMPQKFVNIDGFLETKLRALKAYDAEMRKAPHPRCAETVRALATVRGSQSGFMNAEAFTVFRMRAE